MIRGLVNRGEVCVGVRWGWGLEGTSGPLSRQHKEASVAVRSLREVAPATRAATLRAPLGKERQEPGEITAL